MEALSSSFLLILTWRTLQTVGTFLFIALLLEFLLIKNRLDAD